MAVPAAVARVTLMRPPSAAIITTSAIAAAAPRRFLHPRTKIVTHASLHRLSRLRRRSFRGKWLPILAHQGRSFGLELRAGGLVLAQLGLARLVRRFAFRLFLDSLFVRPFSGSLQLRM